MSQSYQAAQTATAGADLIAAWVRQICHAPSASAVDVAAACGLGLAAAERVGSQRVFAGEDLPARCELVLDRDGVTVAFADVAPRAALTVDALAALFGTGRELPRGPHDRASTVLFDDVWPDGAVRGCTVLARLAAAPPSAAVASVVLYLQPERYDATEGGTRH